MTKVQAEELEDKSVLAVLLLIFYATINKKCLSFAPLAEAELATRFWGRRKRVKEKKSERSPSPRPALEGGGRDSRRALQARAGGAQDTLGSKKALPHTGNQTRGSSDTDLESTLLFASLVGHT